MPLDTHCPRFSGNGEEVKVVQELLRHSTSRMTVDTYTQALGPDRRAAQSEVAGMIRPRERVFSVYRDADVRVIFGAILDDKREAPSKFLPMLTACGTSSSIGLPPMYW